MLSQLTPTTPSGLTAKLAADGGPDTPSGSVAALSRRVRGRRVVMVSRRTFLAAVGSGLVGAPLAALGQPSQGPRKKMAIVTTEWRVRSHAWHMDERFLLGYPVRGQWHRPPL